MLRTTILLAILALSFAGHSYFEFEIPSQQQQCFKELLLQNHKIKLSVEPLSQFDYVAILAKINNDNSREVGRLIHSNQENCDLLAKIRH